ncbi:MAG: Jag N-terminal domain-containing protein [Candidatus Omnitrophota bacterium]|jgi:spoIIIJ-associated protein
MNKRKSLEIEEKTVESAIKKALEELKLDRSQVKIEILCEEKKGLFGMAGAKLAKIRVTVLHQKKI